MKMMKTRKLGIILIAAVLLVTMAFAGVGIAEDDFEDDFEDDYEDINAVTVTSVSDLDTALGDGHLITANTLKLTHNVELTNALTIKNSDPAVAIILDLNGYTISPESSGYRFATLGDRNNENNIGNFTVVDTNETKKGAISGFKAWGDSGGGFFIKRGLLTLSPGANIKDCEAKFGGGIQVDYYGKLIMNGGTISNCTAVLDGSKGGTGGGVLVTSNESNYGEFIMNGGRITNCSAAMMGGGVYIKTLDAIFKVKDNAIITDNTIGTDIDNNLCLIKKGQNTALITLTGDFTGQIGIAYSKTPIPEKFGVVASSSYKGAENFVLDNSNPLKVGLMDGTNLVWAEARTVTFNPNFKGAKSWTKNYGIGALVTEPDGPTRTGYNLEGWYNTTKHKWDFATDKVSADVTLKAHWTKKTTAITLDPNGGVIGTSEVEATYGCNTLDREITNPTRGGYIFGGWCAGDETNNAHQMVIDTDGNLVKGVAGYTDANGNWINEAPALTLKAHWTAVSHRGHSASIPKDYTPSSSVPPMVQETAKPTTAPTLAAPTMMPTTKPTATTSKSPAPVAGLIAGLGAAALVLARMRR